MNSKASLWILLVAIATAVGVFIGSQLNQPADTQSASGMFEDAEHGVSFEYPSHWETRESGESTLFAVNFDYLDGLAKSSQSTEVEGTLLYNTGKNKEGVPLPDLYEESFEKCMELQATTDPGEFELGPFCQKLDLANWEEVDVNGNKGYISDWQGVPESGEQAKRFFVDVVDENLIVSLTAIRTGATDWDLIDKIAKKTFDSVEIK